MDDRRANPDQILASIKEEEHAAARGHLKIFFGYAAGVGKTYSMLKAAHSAKRRGIDVVAGYVEAHARPATSALLNGLEQIPPVAMTYKGITLTEFDLDAALERKPDLILVDELAHTNAEGCRHSKRYQAVEELLKAGIDVYTTVNVQHIESLHDLVASITQVSVQERIPDSIFDDAGQVELVDIEPEELIERLRAGMIYKDSQAQKALNHFFSLANLTALREISLRRCADRINKLSEKVRCASNAEYYTDEHILVCLSSSPSNPRIIRTAARIAGAFRGAFTALYVETPDSAAMTEENKERLHQNSRLATQLGAKIETVYGEDIALQIAEFARLSGVSKIVMGQSNVRKRLLSCKPAFTERLIENAPNLDIYVIPDRDTPAYREKHLKGARFSPAPGDVLRTLLVLFLCSLTGYLFYKLGFSESNIITVYILGVLVTAAVTSRRIYSLVSSIVSVLVFNFLFIDPRFSLEAYDKGYPVTLLIMFLSAFITSTMVDRIKQYAKQAAQTAYRTKILLETNQLVQNSRQAEEIVAVIANQLVKLLKRDIVFYLADGDKLSEPAVFPAGEAGVPDDCIRENEKNVAAWVYKNNKHAGATTNTLSGAKCLYLAVRVNLTIYGVVGIAIHDAPLDPFEHNIVLSIIGECAMALENERAIREKAKSDLVAQNEKLRANLLRGISHDLRTPLTSISGNAGILLSNDAAISQEKRRQLYTDIYDDSLWLINLVENLLAVTRIQEGSMNLKFHAELMDEVIGEALRHIGRKSAFHTIRVTQSEDFILAKMDVRLMIQVIINIVDNAVKYTPEGSEITIRTEKKEDQVIVTIADNGNGIPDDSKKHIFDMFYTATTNIVDSRRSLGLGLALCKSIVEAHGGAIFVYDNHPKGTVFSFTLPAQEVNLHE